jgi:hypothetical protein
MATHRSTWKRRERSCAALFGARRQPLSGSGGRDDFTASDSNHEQLFIETKLRASWSVRTLFDRTRVLARMESKVPILALASKGRRGCLLVVDSVDLPALLAAYADAGPSGAGSKRGKGPDLSRSGMEPRCDHLGRPTAIGSAGEGESRAASHADEVVGERPKERAKVKANS